MLTFSKGDNNYFILQKENTFIYEYAIKKPGKAHIGFIRVDEGLIIQDIYFTVYFSNKRIKGVKQEIKNKNSQYSYLKNKNGDIFIKELNLLCYESENFNYANRLIPDKVYNMISPDFLKTSNNKGMNY